MIDCVNKMMIFIDINLCTVMERNFVTGKMFFLKSNFQKYGMCMTA